jgi:hypothetical protein
VRSYFAHLTGTLTPTAKKRAWYGLMAEPDLVLNTGDNISTGTRFRRARRARAAVRLAGTFIRSNDYLEGAMQNLVFFLLARRSDFEHRSTAGGRPGRVR